MSSIAKKHDLCVSGRSFSLAIKKFPAIWKSVINITIFARMTPELKERVVSELKESGNFCLMCGDGANDVGALKQSHVGVALLSGFGSLNVDKKGATVEAGMSFPLLSYRHVPRTFCLLPLAHTFLAFSERCDFRSTRFSTNFCDLVTFGPILICRFKR